MRRAVLSSLLLLALLTGCDSAQQNPFIVRVASINDGTPLLADVIASDGAGGAIVPTELAPVELINRPYWSGSMVDPGTGWYDFQLVRYSVHWERVDGGPTSGTGWTLADFDHTQNVTVVVPFNGTATFGALVVPVGMKTREPFLSLQTSGGTIQLVAHIDFVGGQAQNLKDKIHVPATLGVTFANFEDAN